MARGILGGLFGGGDSSVMPGLLDTAGYMDPAEYDRRRQGDAMQGLWAGLLQGSGPSLEPRNFFSALGGGLAASQKSANEFDEAQLRRAQGVAAYQKSQLERDRLRLGYDVTQQYLRDQGAPTTPRPPGAPAVAPDDAGGGSGRGAWGPHADVAIATLREQGFSDAAIQGIMANGLGEGGFDTPWRKAGGGENSFGHWQFNQGGELPGYLDFVQKQGGDPKDTRLQALYVAKRAEEVAPGFKTLDDPQKATDLFATKFERYTGAKSGQRYGLLTDAQRYMTGKPVEAVAPLAEVPRYGSDFERLPSETAIPGLIAAGAPGPAPAPGAAVIPDNALPRGSLPVPGHEYVQLPNGRLGLRATTTGQMPAGDRLPTAVPSVTSTPGGTNGIDLRRGAALEQMLSGQQTAQAGPPLRQLAQFAGPGAAGPVASAAIPPPLPEAPPEAPPMPPGAAPAPAAITYGSGVLGRLPPPTAAAPPADVAPAPGGIPGAAAAPSPAAPNKLFGMDLPVLPASPAPPQVPAIPGLLSPGAPPALTPLAPVGAVPPVQLPPEQAARTRRAQGLALGLDLMGITVPKFIADEAGIEVAARSAQAQEAAKQPFAIQMERLRGDIAQQRAEFEAKSKLQQDEYATKRGFATDQFKSALGQLDDVVKQYTAAGLAGPVAGATAREQARFKNVEATILGPDGQPTTQRMTDLEFTQRREQQAARGSATPQPGDIVGMPAYTPGQEELSRGSSKDILTRRTMAQDAAQSIETNKEARALLDGGIFAGAGSNVETAVAKIGNALKLTGQTTKDTVANTEAYFSTVAQNVGRLIKQFGSGTGLSDADRQYAAAMAAGKQTLDEASIRKILDINDRAGTNVINAHNRSVARVPQGVSLTPLTVELPTPYEKAPATAPRERFYNPRTGTFSP